jgi:serine/threonine protein kinase
MSISSEPKHCPKCQTPLPGDAPQGLCPKCLLAAASLPTDVGQPVPDKTPPSVAELAAAFPHLEILELIGQGGMGFVFKARQPKLDRFVALKILPQSLAADPAFAERFSREGRVLAKLNHPNIVTIHDFGQASGFFYLLMEFVDGVNLRQAMRAGRFTPDQALAIVPKICEALQFAHNEGILHRDIKPENILLDAKGRVKIADFGIAKLVGNVAQASQPAGSGGIPAASSEVGNTGLGSPVNPQAGKPALQPEALTEAGKALGTPNYMAPEQRECSGEVDQRADIYSLGVVFYEMLTGELPLGRFAPPSEKSAADPRVDEVVLRALEKEKAKRYASADEVRTQVETIASNPGQALSGPESVSSETGLAGYLSRWRRIVALLLGINTFTSSLSVKLTDISAIGILGCVSGLGVLESLYPIMRVFFAFSGFFACYGLIGIVAMIEFPAARRRARAKKMGKTDWLRQELLPESTAMRWAQLATFGGALLVLVLGIFKLATLDLSVNELFFGVLLVLILTFVIVIGGVQIRTESTPAKEDGQTALSGHPRAEAQTEKAESGTRNAEIVPRFSRTAIWAVLWILVLPVGLALNTIAALYNASLPPHDPMRWLIGLPGVVLVVLGEIGVLGTTILGWMAVTQIRRSAGKLYGLWLAVFDGLLFPLLAVDLVIARLGAFVWNASCSSLGWDYHDLSIAMDGILIALVCAAVDFLAIRAVWRTVNAGSAGGAGGAPAGQTRNGRVAIICVAAVLVVVALATALTQTTKTPLAVTCHTIQKEVGRQLQETGASYDGLQVTVAEERDSGTPFTVSYRGLRNFKYTHGGQPDPKWPASASGQFIMEYTGGGQWQGKLGDRQFTVQAGRTDNIDLPFVDDPQILGTWESVNFVTTPSDFVPDSPKPKFLSNPCYNDITFLADGKTSSWWRWTKGVVIHQGNKTASHYEMQDINGQLYMFVEWKNGDVVLLGMKPKYWVLKKSVFGPVVERLLTVGNGTNTFYSFDRGDYVPGPTDFDPAGADEKNQNKLWKWLTSNHVDVFARTRDGRPVLVHSEMVTTDLNEDDFDRLSPAMLDENPTWKSLLNGQVRPQESSTVGRGKLRGSKDTQVFQNRYEVTGLLQVVAVTSDPPGMKIRYKLVQPVQK